MKSFDQWNNEKQKINKQHKLPLFKEREVFYAQLGLNIGYEQDGVGNKFIRPVIVFKKFNNSLFWAIPLTSRIKTGKYYFEFSFLEEKKSCAILSQLRIIDARRLLNKIGMISKTDFMSLYKKMNDLLIKHSSFYNFLPRDIKSRNLKSLVVPKEFVI